MKFIKCKDCILLDKCPSGQRCVKVIKDLCDIVPLEKQRTRRKQL